MPIGEITTPQAQIAGALRDGLEALDLNQQVTFQAYTRVVLPLDRYIFWSPTTQLVAKGSLHYAQDQLQEETETYAQASVQFTSEGPVTAFDAAGSETLFVASAAGFKYAFSQQQGFYQQAGLYHYFGRSIAPAMLSQLIDPENPPDPAQAVVSNSLPLWIDLNNYTPAYLPAGSKWAFTNSIPLYPSFATPPDAPPIYGSVHIGDADTRAVQSIPFLDVNRNHYQLAADRVRVTLYGLQNDAAMDFLDCVLQYSLGTDNFGIMNTPIVRDGKRPQSEITALAMQKFIDFEISYYQTRVANVARKLITSALPIAYTFETL